MKIYRPFSFGVGVLCTALGVLSIMYSSSKELGVFNLVLGFTNIYFGMTDPNAKH